MAQIKSEEAPARPRAINPALKFALEFGPLALFFLATWKFDLFVATGVLMVAVVTTLGISYALLRRLPIMPLVTAVIVLIFGALTLYFENKTFIKIKPTVLYLLFAGALLGGLAFGKLLLPVLFDNAIQVTEEGWRKLTYRWSFFFVGLAALNELVWRTQSDNVWSAFKSFGVIPLIFLFAIAQAPLIMKYESKDAPSDAL